MLGKLPIVKMRRAAFIFGLRSSSGYNLESNSFIQLPVQQEAGCGAMRVTVRKACLRDEAINTVSERLDCDTQVQSKKTQHRVDSYKWHPGGAFCQAP